MPVLPCFEDPLTLSLSPRGEGTPSQRPRADSLSQPHPLADAATLRCKLAKASLLGEGWGEGVLRHRHMPHERRSRHAR